MGFDVIDNPEFKKFRKHSGFKNSEFKKLAEQSQQHALLWGKSIPDSQLMEAHVPEICQQLISQKVSGVFFAPLELTPRKDAINQLIVKTFTDADIPVVLLDRDLVPYPQRSELDLVGIDNRRAGHIITAHLLSAGAKPTAGRSCDGPGSMCARFVHGSKHLRGSTISCSHGFFRLAATL